MELTQTSRLIINSFCDDDAAFVLQLLHSPGWLQNIGRRPVDTLEQARVYIAERFQKGNEDGFGCFAVRLVEEHTTVGLISLLQRETLDAPDIGYALLPDYTGSGYALEATGAVVEHVISKLRLSKLYAVVKPGNKASESLLHKLAFKCEGTVIVGEETLQRFERHW
jgi:ribosomal-protein-alanine N-acetyltransferase